MSSQAEQFHQLVEQGCIDFTQLCVLLDQERDAIEQRALDQLRAVVNEKAALLEQIAANINARNEILTQAGYSTDDQGLHAFLESLPTNQSQRIQTDWQQLAAQLQTANALNQRNEKVISRSQQSVNQLLGILQGHSQQNTLYNQSGAKGNYSPRNTLGKA